MGLDIEFHFDNGRIHKVHMCYSNFSNKVMSIQDMIKWGFTDHDGNYIEGQLDFLIDCLIRSRYLKKSFDFRPFIAKFC